MKRQLLVIIAVLMILSLACSFLQPKNQPSTDGPTATLESGSKDKGDGDGDGDEGSDTPEEDDGDGGSGSGGEDGTSEDEQGFSLDADAFAQLDYYRSTIVMSYEKGDGTIEETIIEASYIREPAAQSMMMESNSESMEVIQIEDQMWVRFGGEWMQTSADEGTDVAEGFSSLMVDSDDIEQFEQGDYKYVGSETIDGIKTRHYQGEYLAPWMMAFADDTDDAKMEKGVVDVWVADESNLPKFTVKMIVVMEGTVNDAEAKYTMSQTVTDINKQFTIEPPSADVVGGLPEGVPLYPDAVDVTTFGGMTVFASSDSVDDVAAFYNDALESGGWERTENMEIESMVTSQWQKDGETLSVNISPGEDDSGSSVMIITGEE